MYLFFTEDVEEIQTKDLIVVLLVMETVAEAEATIEVMAAAVRGLKTGTILIRYLNSFFLHLWQKYSILRLLAFGPF